MCLSSVILVDGHSPERLDPMANWKGCGGSVESRAEGDRDEQGVAMSRILDDVRVFGGHNGINRV